MMSFNNQPEESIALQAKEGASRKSRNAKKKISRNNSNFIPVPKGSPMFMFQGVEGKPGQ